MTDIHNSAMIDPAAELADDVSVGPYTVIGPHVRIGRGTRIGSHCVIENHTTIGEDNRIFHHVTLGQEPQDLKFNGEDATLIIGDRNDIREHVTMHIGTENGGGSTTVGHDNLLMVGSHIAHDSHIHSHIILANNTMLAGHVTIEDHAIVSGGGAISHFVTIGRHAFIGGLAGVVHDCPPYMISDGHPAHVRGVNMIGLQRHKFPNETITALKDAYRQLFKRQSTNEESRAAVFSELLANHADIDEIQLLIQFIKRSNSGVHGRYAEQHRPDNKRTRRVR